MSVVRTGHDNLMFVALDKDSTHQQLCPVSHRVILASLFQSGTGTRSRGWNSGRSKNTEQTYRYAIVCRLAVVADASLPFHHGNVG